MITTARFCRVSGSYQEGMNRLPDPGTLLNIPAALKARPCWLIWKLKTVKGRLTKVPYQTRDPDAKAKSTVRRTWSGFYETLEAYMDDRAQSDYLGSPDLIAGIGSVFDGDGYCGIDLDGCLLPDGTIDPDFIPIIEGFKETYTETSWSGAGLHPIIRCDDPPDNFTTKWTVTRGKHKGKREVAFYSTKRFFVFTGKVYGTATGVKTYTGDEVRDILKTWIPEKRPRPDRPAPGTAPDLSDRDIIERASKARNGSRFLNLYHGNWSRYPSMSEADLGLAGVIAFYTQDVHQITRIMQTSGLQRQKWIDRPEYLQDTIEKALEGLTNTYNPQDRKRKLAEEGRRILAQWGAT